MPTCTRLSSHARRVSTRLAPFPSSTCSMIPTVPSTFATTSPFGRHASNCPLQPKGSTCFSPNQIQFDGNHSHQLKRRTSNPTSTETLKLCISPRITQSSGVSTATRGSSSGAAVRCVLRSNLFLVVTFIGTKDGHHLALSSWSCLRLFPPLQRQYCCSGLIAPFHGDQHRWGPE